MGFYYARDSQRVFPMGFPKSVQLHDHVTYRLYLFYEHFTVSSTGSTATCAAALDSVF